MEDDNLNLDFFDYDFANDNSLPSLLCWLNQSDDGEALLNSSSSVSHDTQGIHIERASTRKSDDAEVKLNSSNSVSRDREWIDIGGESVRKRLRTETCCKTEIKAIREKLRRERFNEKFVELSSIIGPGRPVRSDKVAILDDAIRLLKQLKTEAQVLEEARKNLNEEIKNLKAEKNELREEKVALKADKERIEMQLKMIASTNMMPPHPAGYHPMANKMTPMFPGFGVVPVPMWQYLSPAAVDISKDHELRPPAA